MFVFITTTVVELHISLNGINTNVVIISLYNILIYTI